MTVEPLKYEVIIYWSEADAAFIAEMPELPGCQADGPTPPGGPGGHRGHRPGMDRDCTRARPTNPGAEGAVAVRLDSRQAASVNDRLHGWNSLL